MSSWFGLGGSKKKTPTLQEALENQRQTQETIQKRIDFLNDKIENELKFCKANLNNPAKKKECLRALKRKKALEDQVATLEGGLENLSMILAALEAGDANRLIMDSIRQANALLAAANKKVDAGQAEDLLLDVQEQMEQSRQITDVISTPMAAGQVIDPDDLEAELAALSAETAAEQLPAMPVVPMGVPSALPAVAAPAFPAVPSDPLEDELAMLAKSMAF